MIFLGNTIVKPILLLLSKSAVAATNQRFLLRYNKLQLSFFWGGLVSSLEFG